MAKEASKNEGCPHNPSKSFIDYAENKSISMEYEEDWIDWWDCWCDGYNRAIKDIKGLK